MTRTDLTNLIMTLPGLKSDIVVDSANVPMIAGDAANGNLFTLAPGDVLLAYNSDGSAQTITISSVVDRYNREGDIAAYSIGAGEWAQFGEYELEGWRQPDGMLYVDVSDPAVRLGILAKKGFINRVGNLVSAYQAKVLLTTPLAYWPLNNVVIPSYPVPDPIQIEDDAGVYTLGLYPFHFDSSHYEQEFTGSTLTTGSNVNDDGEIAWSLPGKIEVKDGTGTPSNTYSAEALHDLTPGATPRITDILKLSIDANDTIPSGVTITGFEIEITRGCSTPGSTSNTNDHTVQLMVDGVLVGNNQSAGALWSKGSYETVTFGADGNLLGATITADMIRAGRVAVGFKAVMVRNTGFNYYAYVDCIKLTVHYYYPGTTYPQRVTGIGDGQLAVNMAGERGFFSNGETGGLLDDFPVDEGSFMIWWQTPLTNITGDDTERPLLLHYVDADNWFYLGKNANEHYLVFERRAGGATKQVIIPAISMVAGWNCLAASWSMEDDEIKVFLNGAQVGGTQTGLGTWSGSAVRGGLAGEEDVIGVPTWKGDLAHAVYWKRAITPAEAASLAVV